MATTEVVTSDQLVDTAIGPVKVTQKTVTGFDVDDYVSTTVKSLAIAVKMTTLAKTVSKDFAKNRRKVDIGGYTVGGY